MKFGSNNHINIQVQPQSEVYIKQYPSEADIYHLKTYSLALEKVTSEKCNTIQQIDTGKHSSNIITPLIIKQVSFDYYNKQSGSELQINLDAVVQFNQPSLTFMHSNAATFNFIKVSSNNEFQQNDFEEKDYSPNLQHYDNNFESNHFDIAEQAMPSPRKSAKFKAAGNLVLGIRRTDQNISTIFRNQEQFYQKFSPSPCQTSKNKTKIHPAKSENEVELMDILNQFKLVDHLINHSISGSDYDIQQMIKILQRDPKRNLMNPRDPNHIINQPNQYGQNALYTAAKNGHPNVVKFLLSADCNPYIRSNLYAGVSESPLEVSVRWHHINCVKMLLDKVQYTNQELRNTIKISGNQQITQLLQSKISSSFFSCCF